MKQVFDLYNMSILLQEEASQYRVLIIDIYSGSIIYPFDTLTEAINCAFDELLAWFQEILFDFEELNQTDPINLEEFEQMIHFPLSLAVPSSDYLHTFNAHNMQKKMHIAIRQSWERMVANNTNIE